VVPLAAGAGRLAAELARSYPSAEVVRMEGFDAPGPARRPALAVMTRGSVVTRPAWLRGERAGVVVVPDADALLGRPSLDAAEDALRLWLAAGHWSHHLVVQTREPGHPAVQALVRWDPEGFWRREAERRADLSWPPHSSLVRLGAPLEEAAQVAAAVLGAVPDGDEVLGPDPDGAVLVKSRALRGTLAALAPLRHDWGKRSVRVRVDVDPVP
jgi:primosomal protein N' (replication factor Y)